MERTLVKPEKVGNVVLTDRDKRWIRAAHRFGVITTDQAMVIGRASSRKAVNDRLSLLWAHDYLARPVEVMRKLYSHADKRHVLHMLGQEGARYLRDYEGVELAKKKGYTSVAQDLKGQNIPHDIGMVDFILALDRAVEDRSDIRVTHQLELLALNKRPLDQKPGRLPTKALRKGSLVDRATDPDYTFELHKRTPEGDERHGLCFLEYDNDSEDFVKSNLVDSSIRQKHEGYTYAYKRKLHTQLYGRNNFRVLFVVNASRDRVKKMQRVYQDYLSERIAPGVFLYATVHDVQAHGVFGEIWTNGAGERVVL